MEGEIAVVQRGVKGVERVRSVPGGRRRGVVVVERRGEKKFYR